MSFLTQWDSRTNRNSNAYVSKMIVEKKNDCGSLRNISQLLRMSSIEGSYNLAIPLKYTHIWYINIYMIYIYSYTCRYRGIEI